MPIYYIATNTGFLKQYYSEQNLSSINDKKNSFSFTVSLRNAKMFKSVEEANAVMNQDGLENCIIIDQNGRSLEL